MSARVSSSGTGNGPRTERNVVMLTVNPRTFLVPAQLREVWSGGLL